MKKRFWAMSFACAAALLNAATVPNPSFENNDGNKVKGWTLSTPGKGGVSKTAKEGNSSVFVLGDGVDSHYWLSDKIQLEGDKAYRITFWMNGSNVTGGTAVTGPVFANVDAGRPTGKWEKVSNVFVVPSNGAGDNAKLRFGQWHAKGRLEFDAISIAPVQPIYHSEQGVTLGAGEKITINEYIFNAPLTSEGRNHSRPLKTTTATFNTSRWVFGQNSQVIYEHDLTGKTQLSATLNINVNYHVGGILNVSASTDGKNWTLIGTLNEMGVIDAKLPGKFFPAKKIFVRLAAANGKKVGSKDSDPGSFQVNRYEYKAVLDGSPVSVVGATNYIELNNNEPNLRMNVVAVGNCIPGENNVATVQVKNNGNAPIALTPASFTVPDLAEDAQPITKKIAPLTLNPNATKTLEIPYDVQTTGDWRIKIALNDKASFAFAASVPQFLDASYGEVLDVAPGQASVWTASSGWKIHQKRSVPTKKGEAVAIEMARNEAEAVQVVVKPVKDIKGVTIAASELKHQDGKASLPASVVELLQVYYHDVAIKTDKTGYLGMWPDALPPIDGPMTLKANINQPFWVRVTAPKDAVPGTYTGTISFNSADGWKATVPLKVHVFDFVLPEKMTCETAFGFTPGSLWQYHKVNAPKQRRELLHKYLLNYSKHHISPYNPAPLDRIKFTVKNKTNSDITWRGSGTHDYDQKSQGKSSLRLQDNSTSQNYDHGCAQSIVYPKDGVTIQFKYKAAKGHRSLFTLCNNDSDGQWMSGRNIDTRFTGTGKWETFERVITKYPKGAVSFDLRLRPTLWTDDGSTTGEVWFDEVKIKDNTTGKLIVDEGFEPVNPKDLVIEFDWENWDKAMDKAFNEYHFTGFRLHVNGLGGGTFHARSEPTFAGFGEHTKEYKSLFPKYLAEIQNHLEEKGWLDKAYVYWFDEPAPRDYEFVMNGFRKLKTYAPKIRRMLTEQVEPELIGGPNLWCPVTSSIDLKTVPERQKEGERFWWYVCTGPKAPYATLFIDHPGTEMRVWLWQTWQNSIDGILVWASNYWTSPAAYPDHPQNPYLDPMGWVSGYSTPKGAKHVWGNGDGRFIYPPLTAANADSDKPIMDGPVDSFRWEMLRDGIEDYEYFVMLKKAIERKKNTLTKEELAEYENLLVVPEDVTTTLTEFNLDPAAMENHRRKLAQAIEKLK